jgi:hypothetical protein
MSTGGLSRARLGCIRDVMGGHVEEVMDTLQEAGRWLITVSVALEFLAVALQKLIFIN